MSAHFAHLCAQQQPWQQSHKLKSTSLHARAPADYLVAGALGGFRMERMRMRILASNK